MCAVRIAEAAVPLVLNFGPIDVQLDDLEGLVKELERQMRAAQGLSGPGAFEDLDLGGFQTLPSSIRQAMSPTSPYGRGWSLGEDIGASLKLLSFRMPANPLGVIGGAAAYTTGGALLGGDSYAHATGQGLNSALEEALDMATDAGKKAAGISSPSRKMADDVMNPVMQGATQGVVAGTPGVADTMTQAIDNTFYAATGEPVQPWHVPPSLAPSFAGEHVPTATHTDGWTAGAQGIVPPPAPPGALPPLFPLRPAQQRVRPRPQYSIKSSGAASSEYQQAVERGIRNAMRYLGAT